MPKEAYGVAALVAALIAAFFLVTYSGPYQLISDFSEAWFHTNLITISFLLTMGLIATPLCLLVWAGERKWGKRDTWFTPIWSSMDRILNYAPGKMLMVGVILAVMGGYFALKDIGAGPLTKLSVADLEDGHPPKSTYVELSGGRILEDTNITFTSDSTVYRYLPVIDHADAVVLFLRLSGHEFVPAGKIRGILERNGMEGELASQLQKSGAIASPHYVLGVGRVPDPMVGGWMAFAGLVLSVIGLTWWRISYAPPVRRTPPPPPVVSNRPITP